MMTKFSIILDDEETSYTIYKNSKPVAMMSKDMMPKIMELYFEQDDEVKSDISFPEFLFFYCEELVDFFKNTV